ncbi:MAG TPA: TetR family transcriptional regulator [Streptosporangiaceae bacterium]|nr:TetR family transcriptional regulator [Streptosporangiaceae bacterium]
MASAFPDRGPAATRRPRNAAATRRALLEAAGDQFARRGFAGTSMRDVARAAGVDQALVYRYFGSKAALHEEVNRHYAERLADLFNFGSGDFAAHVVTYLLTAPASVRIEPLLALLRGNHAGTSAAMPVHRLFRDFVHRLARKAGGPPEEARLRAAMIGALTVGIPIMREVIGDPSLASAQPHQVAPLYAEAVRALLRPGDGGACAGPD